MRGVVRGGAALLVSVGLVVGAGARAGAKPQAQSSSAYATTVCTAYGKLLADLNHYGDSISALDPTDATQFQSAATLLTAALVTKVKAAQKKLAAAYPDISGGQKVGALLSTNAAQLATALKSAMTQLGAGGVDADSQFTTDIQALATKLSDPFTKVTDQGLISAFQQAKACKNVVEVTKA